MNSKRKAIFFTAKPKDSPALPAAVARTRQVTGASVRSSDTNSETPAPDVRSKPPKRPKHWHPQQEVVLKQWAEIATSFRWMHHECHVKMSRQSFWFTLPVIVLSSITGTMNFAQGTFPSSVEPYIPVIIGSLNLVGGIMTTIASYLKVAEMAEGHRVASVMFGKLSRNIRVELLLPLSERTMDGDDFIAMCRSEMDRLTEQTPDIPKQVEKKFAARFHDLLQKDFYPPELLQLHPVDVYRDETVETVETGEERAASVVASAALQFQRAAQAARMAPLAEVKEPLPVQVQSPPKGEVKQELAELSRMKTVSSVLRREWEPAMPSMEGVAPFFDVTPTPSEDALGSS